MHRKNFLRYAGLLSGGSLLLPQLSIGRPHYSFDTWAEIREQFLLSPEYIHMSQMLLASHPMPVRKEIEKHRNAFDKNPATYWRKTHNKIEEKVQAAAANYLGAETAEVVLTDSTSMGLGILYSGFRLKPGDEILTTTHDHFVHEKSQFYAAAKNEASIKRINLYDNAATANADEIINRLTKAIGPKTKIVAVTWVHSCTGVKLPIAKIGAALQRLNARRKDADRIYFCVDGVHAMGVENIDVRELNCDFLSAGTHKWLFGPRGTGILWGKKDAWQMIDPTLPSSGGHSFDMWMGRIPEGPLTFSELCTPGGFHSFEHRWSLHKAFEFHLQIGKEKVEQRTHELSSLLKEGLKNIKHVKLITPVSPELSAGINCFEVDGIQPGDVVKELFAKNIIASRSPYRTAYARLAPCIINNEEEIRTCLSALENIKAG